MLPDIAFLKTRLADVIVGKHQQGYQTAGVLTELKRLPDSYDALAALAQKIAELPFRGDWPYSEPNDLESIWAQCAADRPTGPIGGLSPSDAAPRVETAFLAAVCGCMLGKPLECDPTLAEIRQAAERCNEWPLNDYISEALLAALGRRHPSAFETMRGHIHYVAPDDDINYTVLGMRVIEKHGVEFTKNNLMTLWLENLPPGITFGPERTILVKAAIESMNRPSDPAFERWVDEWNPKNEACGAAIRVDAYGYAAAGYPALAAELAWRDSSMTHHRTGIYASMFIAAAIAAAFVAETPLGIFETALKFVPTRTRFHEIMSDCLGMVAGAADWLDGYGQINRKYGQYRHCQLYQECGLLINTARFANDTADAFCKQVAQGCDTDCFGEIIGSIMGAYFGPGSLDERWLQPFRDDLHVALGDFHERSLVAVAKRMGRLPVVAQGSVSTGVPSASSLSWADGTGAGKSL